jgi:ATP-dependent RNA helicase DHX57
VRFVVDAGRVKQLSYDPATRMSSLDDVRVSSAAAKQRRGRAGRVAEGLCVHIYPSDERLDAYTEPEVRRVPLEQLVMRAKALRLPGLAAQVCAELPEPPAAEAVLSPLYLLWLHSGCTPLSSLV